ncbi:DEAD/DEAH box helicase [Nocardioides solisilvae]|uniref:DEAD/DEAH box helicase n=1 Tax=Nocardioides solisilvae TaxID=1542435 RepID=UPI000D741FA6|nr:DEAD/DEAH box helicase [Nocardioides solisilvae]
MSFVPLDGPATLRSAEPPREGRVVFTGRRTVELPIAGALPVLARAHRDEGGGGGGEVHPSVALLAGAAHLALRLVAEGRLEPHPTQPWWQAAPLRAADRDRVEQLARVRAHDGMDEATAEGLVLRVLDAVVDSVPRRAPTRPVLVAPDGRVPRGAPGRAFPETLEERLARLRRSRGTDDRPQLVQLSLRVEADEDDLYAGELRVVPQVHAEGNPVHMADAAELWLEAGPEAAHGFGDRARTHAVLALRQAATAWPVLDRLLDLRVPDRITLSTDEVVDLLEHGLAALQEVGVDVHWPRELGRDLTGRAVLDAAPRRRRGEAEGPVEGALRSGLLGADHLFAFRWQLALHGDPLTDDEMASLAAATRPVMRLRDSWVVVPPDVARKARRRLIRTVKPTEAVAAALTGVTAVDDAPEVEVVVGASLLAVRERLRAAGSRPPVPVPAGLDATLRDYQRQGLTWLAELTDLGLGACLADDMGLGKTITLIALHLHRAEQRGATGGGPTLVVCPASLLGNWEAEIRRFAPGVPVRRFHGGARSLAPDAGGALAGFVLTTYGTMRNDVDSETGVLRSVPWDLVVADEAQHVKNSRSSTARALRRLESAARVALTGTPVENDLTELWSILDWAVPGLLGSRLAFRRVWASPIEAGVDPAVTARFAELVSPFLLRRRKSDPGIAPELPAKTETDHLLGLTREQAVLYEGFVRERMERIERAEPQARRGLVLAMLTGLKQICNHPAHFLREHSLREHSLKEQSLKEQSLGEQGPRRPARRTLSGRSEKVDLLDEILGTVLAEEGAVLVFTQYVAMGRLLEQHLARAGVPHQFLHGGTPVAEREAMVRRFQAGPDDPDHVPVFLLSLKAGGTGLNLTRADHVVHFDRWWNPAVEEQATDRAYRIGQTRRVQVHRFVVQGTVEERIALLLDQKRSLADAVLARGETALTELSDRELRDLVELR